MFESCSINSMVFSSMLVARAMSVRVTIPTNRFPSVIGSFFTLSLNINRVASRVSMSGVPVITCLVITSDT